ncbi:hypothetical protein HK405_009113, partial [Cladochytrium tenue]
MTIALFQVCVNIMIKNRSLFSGQAAQIAARLQDPPAGLKGASICCLLLNCGSADINAFGPQRVSGTTLLAAAQARADDVFGLLLEKGANSLAREADGRTTSDLYLGYFKMLEKKAKRKMVLQR